MQVRPVGTDLAADVHMLFLLHPPLLLLLLLLLHALPSLRKITATAVTKSSSALPEMPTTCLPL